MVRTRIAPSPTGQDLHIGTVYTALLNYSIARKNNGRFVIRIEDTDQKRKVEGAQEKMLSSLAWVGITSDEPVIRQSTRLPIYKKYALELVEKGHAYVCDCTATRLDEVRKSYQEKKLPPRYDGYCRERTLSVEDLEKEGKPYVIRLKVPRTGETVFHDVIRGEIRFKNELIDDQVLLKSDGFPTYHLAVVIDDHLMKISHIIRGEEWISSAPKHVLLYKFFGWEHPLYAHHPLLRNPDKSKLSKRKNPVWVSWFREQGLLPAALLNYLGLMGFSMPDEREIFSLEEFIREFSLERVQTSAPVFDIEKLKWMNGEYIRKMDGATLKNYVVEYINMYVVPITNRPLQKNDDKVINQSIPLIQTRIKTLSEYWPMCEFLFERPTEHEQEVKKEWLTSVTNGYKELTEWNHDTLYKKGTEIADELGVSKSKLFMDIRIALSGKKIGPPLFESMEILGKEECLTRLQKGTESSLPVGKASSG